jgi:hypothetical protein
MIQHNLLDSTTTTRRSNPDWDNKAFKSVIGSIAPSSAMKPIRLFLIQEQQREPYRNPDIQKALKIAKLDSITMYDEFIKTLGVDCEDKQKGDIDERYTNESSQNSMCILSRQDMRCPP